jgi:uncharacterized protein (TIGR03437 family)
MQLDTVGNIYVAGTFVSTNANFYSAFVAKLSADGSQVLYFTALAGSAGNNYANALAVGSDGSVYVGGSTFSPDFPVTAGALQSTVTGASQGFFAKLNPAGALVYSTFLNGPATSVTGVALDGAGDVFLTGLGETGLTSSSQPFPGFVVEVNAGLSKVVMSAYGYGGGLISLDGQGNIYLTGSAQPAVTFTTTEQFTLPPLPAGSFQPTHHATFCFTSGDSGPGVGGIQISCLYQYVAKLNPTGRPLWATYVTGTYGAIASAIAVDSAGNVIVAGTTYSDDYPVTAGAFQTAYAAAEPAVPVSPGSTYFAPPPATGYITKVNSTGTGLIWSTYFGGSYADSITGMAISPTGDLYVSGHAQSSDLPALAGTPDACRPFPNQMLAFVTRLASDGTTAGPTQLVQGAPDCLYFSCGAILYDDYPNYLAHGPLVLNSNGTALFAGTDGTLASIDFSSSSRLSCLVDPADYAQLGTVSPGQLLALFGTDLAPATPFIPPTGVAASTATFGVFFNGIPAPILYSGGQQINVQVPFEIAGQSTVQMQVIDQQTKLPLSETVTLGVVKRQPAIYLTPAAVHSLYPESTLCGGMLAFGVAAVAVNADGTLNDCANPAIAGSVVTVFVDGLGPVTPALATGAIAAGPPVPLTPAFAAFDDSDAPIPTSTLSLPGAITGVSQVQFQLPQGLSAGPYAFRPTLDGAPLRERFVVVWTRSN